MLFIDRCYNLLLLVRWKPLTCGCEIELNDRGNWRSTLYSCDLHKDFSGEALLEEVRKHNRENSPKREPNTMEGWIGGNFEPDWLKQVRKYPSKEKLEETKFNLDMMKLHHPTYKEFQYCLSNFLNSSKSVLWYLLQEYSRKYEFDIGKYFKYRKDKNYAKKHQGAISEEANRFLTWYEGEFSALQNGKAGFLLDKRDINIHKGYVELIFELRQPFKVQGERPTEIPLDLSKVYAIFPNEEGTKAIELCSSLVERMESLINNTHERFPL
jgi:hypothetical protein